MYYDTLLERYLGQDAQFISLSHVVAPFYTNTILL